MALFAAGKEFGQGPALSPSAQGAEHFLR